MAPADRAWLNAALARWVVVEREQLRLAPAPLPTIVTADERCAYTASGGSLPLRWTARVHGGKAELPDGSKAPVTVMSFAGPATGKSGAFFVMTLPSVWRKGGVTSGLGLERLMTGVLLHEMMHTRQFAIAGPLIAALEAKGTLPKEFSDDALQEAFQRDPAYLAAYRSEAAMLYAAVFEPDERRARALARSGLAMMDARRARWLGGRNGDWGRADQLFLAMEGLGQWLFYAHAHGATPGRRADPTAVRFTRRDQKWWSQDEGLALFLLLDRFAPDWRAGGSATDPRRLRPLLDTALRRSSPR